MSKSTTSPNSAAAHQWAVVAPTLPAPMIVIFRAVSLLTPVSRSPLPEGTDVHQVRESPNVRRADWNTVVPLGKRDLSGRGCDGHQPEASEVAKSLPRLHFESVWIVTISTASSIHHSRAITCRENSWSVCRKCHNNRQTPIMASARKPPTAAALGLFFTTAAGFQSGAEPITRGAVCKAREDPGLASFSSSESAVGYCQVFREEPGHFHASRHRTAAPQAACRRASSSVQNTSGLFCDPSATRSISK